MLGVCAPSLVAEHRNVEEVTELVTMDLILKACVIQGNIFYCLYPVSLECVYFCEVMLKTIFTE